MEYQKIFKPETINLLKGKSGESLRQMLGNKNLMQTLMRSQQVLSQVINAEEEFRDELNMVAIQMVKDAFPIIDYAGIEIDAEIIDMNQIPEFQQKEAREVKFREETEMVINVPEDKKRRIINGITQGASIRGAFGFMMYREYLDELNPELVENYNEILKLSFGIYDNEEAIALMLQLLGNGQKQEGGVSFVKKLVPESDEEDEEGDSEEQEEGLVIVARAICFPMLVHEIIKGLYEILSLQGFTADKVKNQSVSDRIDKLENEPDDLRFGKFIYDSISELYNQSNFDDPRIRELLFTEIYKLENDDFFPFIENAINKTLTSSQKRWVQTKMQEIESDLKADDSDESLY